ncbi:MAG: NAD(P)/FAD-dependent oxidoreductase [Selenomonadaceae bacterium]|nr:NAD(P)/FAD-dependent oxidoreductase [Selenomonadaceae bacterium]
MKRIIVVGGGPAGMMAAVKAAEYGAEVLLLERMDRVGRKMSITGKGRCNITNAADLQEILSNIPGNGAFLNSSLRAFDQQDVIRFFEEAGVPTKVERGNRVFPRSDKAADVVQAMLERLHLLGVKIRTKARVTALLTEALPRESEGSPTKPGKLRQTQAICGVRLEDGTAESADAVILAVGGASYPGTGSSGDGYPMAERLGHTVTKLLPALVPLETEEEWPKEAQGLSLRNVRVALFSEGKRLQELFGEMLFTHFGVSGPLILSLSRRAAQELDAGHFVEISINLKPALTPEQLDARICRDFGKYIRKQAKNGLHDLLPGKLIPIVLDLAYLDAEKPIHQITQEERRRLGETVQHMTLTISRTRPMAEAIVTSGGISVKEIQPKTMESKLVKGLYFAGEVVDVDAFTGGYNLQAAFSMGAAAGQWSAMEG